MTSPSGNHASRSSALFLRTGAAWPTRDQLIDRRRSQSLVRNMRRLFKERRPVRFIYTGTYTNPDLWKKFVPKP